MTREEAIEILRINKPVIKRTNLSARRYLEAFEMAIEALSAIEDIKAEIAQIVEREKVEDAKWAFGLRYSLKVIDKHISGKESK